jgi:hypothetical protein
VVAGSRAQETGVHNRRDTYTALSCLPAVQTGTAALGFEPIGEARPQTTALRGPPSAQRERAGSRSVDRESGRLGTRGVTRLSPIAGPREDLCKVDRLHRQTGRRTRPWRLARLAGNLMFDERDVVNAVARPRCERQRM